MNDYIKFTHAENEFLGINQGSTIFSDLLTLGAFAGTKTHKVSRHGSWCEYATDEDGLEMLDRKSDAIIEVLSDTLSTLGEMLAYVDLENVGSKHLNNLAWLIAGLGELLSQVSHENREIGQTRFEYRKQNDHKKEE